MRELLAVRPEGGFSLIMADPPWHFRTRSQRGVTRKGAGGQYATMSLYAIKALPVEAVASRDCLLWLWATNPLLPQAFEVMASWGFEFRTAGHWVKTTAHGSVAFGTGYTLRCSGEPFLVGVRGDPALAEGEPFLIGARGRPRTTRSQRSVILGAVRAHSRKPEEAFAAAEQLMPGARRLELFARQGRPGWTGWGDQADHFDGEARGGEVDA